MKLYAWNAFGCSLIFSAVWELPAKYLQILQNNLLFTYKFKKKLITLHSFCILDFSLSFEAWMKFISPCSAGQLNFFCFFLI